MPGLKETESSLHSSKMTAPPSTAYRIVDVPEAYADVIKRHGVPGAFVGPAEQESPWVPFGPNAAIRHLHFDTRHNIFSNTLWIKSPGVIGTHKHRGTVVMVCLEGSARYLEYDWVAGPGDFIYERPGLIHTLVCDHSNGVKCSAGCKGRSSFTTNRGSSWRRQTSGGTSITTRVIARSMAFRLTSNSTFE